MTLRKLWTRLQEPEGNVSGGGSSPAPAPAPAPAPSAPAASPAPSAAPAASSALQNLTGAAPADDFDFGALVDYSEGKGESVASAPETVPPAPAPAPAPAAAAPAPAPAPTPAPAPAPTEPQGAQPPPAATGEPQASSEQPPQPVDWEKHRQEFLPKLESVYALTEQEANDIQTNPATALPKLAAKLHYNVQLALQTAMTQLLPQMISGQMAQAQTRTKYESQFYDRWPKLKEAVAKDPKVETRINQALESYRGLNPKATIQELIDKVGLLSMIDLGINPMEVAPAPAPAAAPAPTPIIPGRPAGTGSQGHVPVRQHGTGGGEESDEALFAGMADHFMNGGG